MTELEILEMRDRATAVGLLGYKLLYSLPLERLTEVCNGIGASFFPPVLRKLLDRLNPCLRYAAMIHDVRYYLGDGTLEDFSSANRDFAKNGETMARLMYQWYDIRRYWYIRKARRYARLCQRFGWYAYLSAIDENERDIDQ